MDKLLFPEKSKDCISVLTCRTLQFQFRNHHQTTIYTMEYQRTWDINNTMRTFSDYYRFLLLIFVSVTTNLHQFCCADPTDGFTLMPLTDNNIKLQKPYNKPLNDRYSYDDGVRRLWVYTNDKPFKQGSGTRPRTEVRINVCPESPLLCKRVTSSVFLVCVQNNHILFK